MELSKFRTENWSDMSAAERLQVLQEVEHSLAEEQGRTEREIHSKQYEMNEYGVTLGEYDPNSSEIYINEDFLTGENEQFNEYFNQYNALETTCHEGRHAYQHDTMGENETFEYNMCGGYQDPENENVSRPDYRFQPIEDDVNNYADQKMNEFSSEFQDDSAYSEYQEGRELSNRADIKAAEVQYGEDYKEDIQTKVEKDYQASQQNVTQYNSSLETTEPSKQNVSQGEGASESGTQDISDAGQSY